MSRTGSVSDSSVSHGVHPLGVGAGLVAVAAWGISGVVAKHIDMGGISISVYRFLLYGIVVTLYMAARGQPPSWHIMRHSFWGGVALAADVALFFSAVKATAVANATVIGSLQPVLLAVVARVVFGELIRRRDLLLGGVALIGAVGVVTGGPQGGEADITGDLLAVGALGAWSTYFVFSKRANGIIGSNEFTVGVALWVGLLNIPVALVFGQSLAWPASADWVWLVGLAFGSGVAGHAAMNWSIQQIPLWLSSSLTLFIPVVSTSAAWMFLGEAVTVIQILSMIVVLVALTGVILGHTLANRPESDPATG